MTPVKSSPTAASPVDEVGAQILAELSVMVRQQLATGASIPASVSNELQRHRSRVPTTALVPLTRAHALMARRIAPATPQTLRLLDEERQRASFWLFLGAVPLVRRLMFAALAFLASLLATGQSIHVNAVDLKAGFFGTSGLEMLTCQAFLLSAAGLGACFSNLFLANRYVCDGTFDSKYDASYWTRIVLGIMAGTMLAEFVPSNIFDGSAFGKPTLAMLGGFSAGLVYRILNRLVQTAESLVNDNSQALAESRRRDAEERAEQARLRQRLQLTQQLLSFQNLHADELSEAAKARLSALLEPPIDDEDQGRALDEVEVATADGSKPEGQPRLLRETNVPPESGTLREAA